MKGDLIVLIVCIAFVISGGYVSCIGFYNVFLAHRSKEWPIANGVVTDSSVSPGDGSESAKVKYTFQVENETHTGDNVIYGDFGTNVYPRAREIVDRYPVGKAVIVFYEPANVNHSVLEPGIRYFVWFLPILGAALVLVGLCGGGFVLRQSSKLTVRDEVE